MKTTDTFKNTIKAYLDKRAQEDALFANSYAKEGKNINDCCTYILNQVRVLGGEAIVMADEEVYSMAVHYYDEDNINVGKPIKSRTVVNQNVELTDEEKEEARQAAIKRYQNDLVAQMKEKATKPKKKAEVVESPSLFD